MKIWITFCVALLLCSFSRGMVPCESHEFISLDSPECVLQDNGASVDELNPIHGPKSICEIVADAELALVEARDKYAEGLVSLDYVTVTEKYAMAATKLARIIAVKDQLSANGLIESDNIAYFELSSPHEFREALEKESVKYRLSEFKSRYQRYLKFEVEDLRKVICRRLHHWKIVIERFDRQIEQNRDSVVSEGRDGSILDGIAFKSAVGPISQNRNFGVIQEWDGGASKPNVGGMPLTAKGSLNRISEICNLTSAAELCEMAVKWLKAVRDNFMAREKFRDLLLGYTRKAVQARLTREEHQMLQDRWIELDAEIVSNKNEISELEAKLSAAEGYRRRIEDFVCESCSAGDRVKLYTNWLRREIRKLHRRRLEVLGGTLIGTSIKRAFHLLLADSISAISSSYMRSLYKVERTRPSEELIMDEDVPGSSQDIGSLSERPRLREITMFQNRDMEKLIGKNDIERIILNYVRTATAVAGLEDILRTGMDWFAEQRESIESEFETLQAELEILRRPIEKMLESAKEKVIMHLRRAIETRNDEETLIIAVFVGDSVRAIEALNFLDKVAAASAISEFLRDCLQEAERRCGHWVSGRLIMGLNNALRAAGVNFGLCKIPLKSLMIQCSGCFVSVAPTFDLSSSLYFSQQRAVNQESCNGDGKEVRVIETSDEEMLFPFDPL